MASSEFENTSETTERAPVVTAPRPETTRTNDTNRGGGGNNGGPNLGGPQRQKPSSTKWVPFVIIGALLAGGALWRARSGKGGGEGGAGGRGNRAPDLPAVQIATVRLGSLSQTLDVTGTLRSNQNINLSSKIAGRVAAVYVQEGSRVRRGQLLVSLDDADLRAQVAQAQAGVRTAQVRLQQTIVGLPAREQQVGTSIEQAQTAVQTAQARLRQAQLNEPKQVTTAESQVSTAQAGVRTAAARLKQARQTARQTELQTDAEVRRTRSLVTAAQATVGAAQARLAEVRRGARDQQVAQAQAAVALAEANLRDAATELNRAKILVNGGAAPRSTVDAAQTRFEVNQAQVESARQNLSLVREGATNEQVLQAQEALRQAQTGVPQAEALLSQAEAGRARTLVAQGEVTAALSAQSQAQSALQTAQAGLAQIPITQQETRVAREAVGQAQAGLSQARANRSQIPIAREDVNAARAALQVAQAQLQQAQVNQNYARIYSPVNGVVNTKLTDAGQTAGPGVTLLNLVALDRVYFEALVGENNVGRVRVGQPARIMATSVSSKTLSGYVSDIIPTADSRLRQFRVRITIPNAPRELTPGAFARGTVTTQTVNNALIVPADALQELDGKISILALNGPDKGAKVQKRPVQTGISAGDSTQIISGVEAGQKIVLNGETLDDGEKVRVATS